MGCVKEVCTAEKIFIFINIGFAMYSGALLATAARLTWDPSTYTWFRFFCVSQYRVSAVYVFCAGVWLAGLVYLAASTANRSARHTLHVYAVGVVCLVVSEVCYGAWMIASLLDWWKNSPQAVLARHGMDLVHDLKPALLAVERYSYIARPVYDMIEEIEREAPNNVFVIIVFGIVGAVLQIAAFVMARRLAVRPAGEHVCTIEKEVVACATGSEEDSDSGDSERAPGWRKKANLRMYTIIDKIF